MAWRNCGGAVMQSERYPRVVWTGSNAAQVEIKQCDSAKAVFFPPWEWRKRRNQAGGRLQCLRSTKKSVKLTAGRCFTAKPSGNVQYARFINQFSLKAGRIVKSCEWADSGRSPICINYLCWGLMVTDMLKDYPHSMGNHTTHYPESFWLCKGSLCIRFYPFSMHYYPELLAADNTSVLGKEQRWYRALSFRTDSSSPAGDSSFDQLKLCGSLSCVFYTSSWS